MPRFIGPYKILVAEPGTSNYELDLPEALTKRRIHPRFHVSRLRPHTKNSDERFPNREVEVYYDFGDDPETEWVVEEITGHRWSGKKLHFQVKWSLGDSTWEPLSNCEQLQALDEYLVLHGVKDPLQLPKRRP